MHAWLTGFPGRYGAAIVNKLPTDDSQPVLSDDVVIGSSGSREGVGGKMIFSPSEISLSRRKDNLLLRFSLDWAPIKRLSLLTCEVKILDAVTMIIGVKIAAIRSSIRVKPLC
jgi:hypothetical protein